jgi:hypothetical protein
MGSPPASRPCTASTCSKLLHSGDTHVLNRQEKTTMAKLNRERRLLERRPEQEAKEDARKRASAHDPDRPGDTFTGDDR